MLSFVTHDGNHRSDSGGCALFRPSYVALIRKALLGPIQFGKPLFLNGEKKFIQPRIIHRKEVFDILLAHVDGWEEKTAFYTAPARRCRGVQH